MNYNHEDVDDDHDGGIISHDCIGVETTQYNDSYCDEQQAEREIVESERENEANAD